MIFKTISAIVKVLLCAIIMLLAVVCCIAIYGACNGDVGIIAWGVMTFVFFFAVFMCICVIDLLKTSFDTKPKKQ